MFVYITVIWTHHQEYVCRELHKLLGDSFKLILTLPLDDKTSHERIAMGWNLIPPKEDWIIGPPTTGSEMSSLDYSYYILNADVVVMGGDMAGDKLVRRRVKSGKLTIFQGERFFKIAWRWWNWLSPRFLKRWYCTWRNFHAKNIHYLTMSHWCADDLAFFHACKGRIWRWGYLTPVSEKPTEKPAREKVCIGWCGRFLDWKKADDLLQAMSSLEPRLREKVEATLVGDGPEKKNLIRLAHSLELDNIVQFKSFMPATEAKAFMRGLDIYVFPSGRQEGWGAVLAEAMDASCAVIANEAAGSTLELVKNGANGFTYKDGDLGTLVRRLSELVENTALRKKFGLAAWQTMQGMSPIVGAERLAAVTDALNNNKEVPEYESGLLVKIG